MLQHDVGNKTRNRPPEDLLANPRPDLEIRRQSQREFDQWVIEQRHTRLQRYGHARAVHLREDVPRQVRRHVHQHHLRRKVSAACVAECSGEHIRKLAIARYQTRRRHPAIARRECSATLPAYAAAGVRARSNSRPRPGATCGNARAIMRSRGWPHAGSPGRRNSRA